jgi:hypothetical protein
MKNPDTFTRLICHVVSFLLLLSWAEPSRAAEGKNPRRLKRSESFLGIHFDFHAGPDCKEIGKNTTREMIESIISQVQPDYLQIDCKGHRGLCSYPTKVGNPAPGFVGPDPLRLWREVTAERGVSLYMHYSGVWDSEAILQHPDWAVVNADGKTNPNATSFFGPYWERLLVPQLRELAGTYKIDGVWVDGECWASMPDYGERALAAFRQATGVTDVPRKPTDPHWREFLEFNRDAFRKYLRNYIAAVKKTNPGFQMCSNWAFTDHMPEPVSAPVDFLSGDYSPQDSVNSARISARYLARQGKPWDLMAWSFTTQPGKDGRNLKTAVQLEREAAVVLALGGGFQAYFGQRRDGSVDTNRMALMAEVARFCRAREVFCHRAESVPQIALVYSTAAHYRRMNGLFPRDHSPFAGTLEALLASQQSVELLGEHQLKGRMQKYPLIVIPEWEYLEPGFVQELLEYVRKGGNLLLVGPKAAALFARDLGAEFVGESDAKPRRVEAGASQWVAKGESGNLKLASGTDAYGRCRVEGDGGDSSWHPAASIHRLGKGRIAATSVSYSRNYLETRSPAVREFLAGLVRELFPAPLVEVAGSSDVDVVVAKSRGKLAINLINVSGPHASEPILDAIAPVGPLAINVRTASKVRRVSLQPSGQLLPAQLENGLLKIQVPRVDVHEIVIIE